MTTPTTGQMLGILTLLATIGIAIGGAAVSALVGQSADRQRLDDHVRSAAPQLEAVGAIQVRLERIEARQTYLADGQEEIKDGNSKILEQVNGRRRR